MLQCVAHLSFLDWHLGDVHSENMGKSLDTLKAWLDLAAWFPEVFIYLFIYSIYFRVVALFKVYRCTSGVHC